MADTFEVAYDDYTNRLAQARATGASHDQLRFLFTTFIQQAFPQLTTAEVQLEQYVKGVQVRGFIDMLYRESRFRVQTGLRP
ncbi:MAG: hypothetical protein IPH65_04745 [Dehalococcoidia bacterium]|uniref:hypothetical protein n=1 Tax=Candidatus Amarobacter glycogenicus TaxID=3140699 RepID=UPI003134DA1E|nr:hypothetical protein [Dehalococcoidia bacterium]